MNALDYPVIVQPLPAEDGGGFLALVPDLPGCMSDGETPEEALANMFYIMDVGEEAEQLYNDAWDEVKINAGS